MKINASDALIKTLVNNGLEVVFANPGTSEMHLVAAIGVKGGGVHSEAQVFDEEIIQRTSKSIGYAIEARKAKYKDETPYSYKPFKDSNIQYVWNDNSRNDLKDYNLEDLSI